MGWGTPDKGSQVVQQRLRGGNGHVSGTHVARRYQMVPPTQSEDCPCASLPVNLSSLCHSLLLYV